ncbi:hypothetical protein M9H77_22160 [Catharanthus roseus]|uniref:Uncharacterized protein n=1 Tax=Catharanthus roseus TaxID=4058 RepID=A0ACC0AS79_CATRO|nr:hypothetical protein M9H77_22160 [Catharanthus roseus]
MASSSSSRKKGKKKLYVKSADVGKFNEFYFDSWINVAIAKNIRHLDLETSHRESIEVLANLFICKTLKFLKLFILQGIIHRQVCFPRLHTLILDFVTLEMRKLFSSI